MPKNPAHNFSLIVPNAQQLDKQRAVAAQMQTLLNTLAENVPAGPEFDQAISSLRTCQLYANQGILTTTASRGAGG
jgi:hypothetical protein